MTVGLVAMAPSGEALVRDPDGRLWLLQPEGAGGSRPLSPETASYVIPRAGLKPIDRDFESWAELDAWRNEKAARITPGVTVDRDALDGTDVERLLGVARRWAAAGEGNRARQLVFELLRVPALLGDPVLHDGVVAFAQSLAQPPVEVVAPPPADPLKAAARHRWQQQRAA